jgi:putative transposase
MPWKIEEVRQQRWRLLRNWWERKTTLAELCRRFGISRKTAYKWRARFEQDGRRGLSDRRPDARHLHNRPSARWLGRVRRARRQHPSWGARKLQRVLCRCFGARGVPSAAAIGRWLRQWQLTAPGRRRTRRGPLIERAHLTVAVRPNQVWSVDFKGWFRTGDGERIDPLTVCDMASHYLIAVELLRDQSVETTRDAFARIFREYGLPQAIRVDNGCPFGSDGALGLTRLSVWWMRLGIRVEFITPGCPGENGAHEQMHKIYQAEQCQPPALKRRMQQRRTAHWRREYNEVRPHEGVGLRVPAEVYRRSPRPMPRRLRRLRYPREWLSRLVKGKGMISLHGRGRFIGEAFEGERVGLKRTGSGWEVYLGAQLIGLLRADETSGIHAARYRGKKETKTRA